MSFLLGGEFSKGGGHRGSKNELPMIHELNGKCMCLEHKAVAGILNNLVLLH